MLAIRIICGILCFIIGYMISIFLDKRHTKKRSSKRIVTNKRREEKS